MPYHSIYFGAPCSTPSSIKSKSNTKFNDAIRLAINKEQIFPEKIKKIFDQKEKMTILDNDIDLIKSYIRTYNLPAIISNCEI